MNDSDFWFEITVILNCIFIVGMLLGIDNKLDRIEKRLREKP